MTYSLVESTYGDEGLAVMHDVVDSGMYTMGERVREFEAAFARYTGARHAVMANSGSSANLLMVAALFFRKENPLRRGDGVIVPAVSWPTTFFPLQQYGLHVKFVDVDIGTLNMSLTALEDAITDRTRLVMAVNLLGSPNDYAALGRVLASSLGRSSLETSRAKRRYGGLTTRHTAICTTRTLSTRLGFSSGTAIPTCEEESIISRTYSGSPA